MYQIRTDLALETQEKMQEDKVELKGVRYFEEKIDKNLVISTVVIETENGAKTMGKPKGTYITIEAGNMDEEDEDYHREVSKQLARIIGELIPVKKEELSVLIVGLGNRAVTPDSLGPRVVDNLYITRHILNEYGRFAFGKAGMNRISSIVPGVMAQTGMESMEIVAAVVKETTPDFVIAVDALAARNTKRLNRTIQVSDTGINPGSGVGNHRHGLNEKSLGKDTMTGHWEMMGLEVTTPFQTFTETGFPKELIEELEKRTGRIVIGNKSASGTEIIEEFGEEEIETGHLIVYTSADSVLQICGNEDHMGTCIKLSSRDNK